MKSELLTKNDIAEMLKVTTRTISRYVSSGILTPIRISEKVVRFRSEEVDRLIAEAGEKNDPGSKPGKNLLKSTNNK